MSFRALSLSFSPICHFFFTFTFFISSFPSVVSFIQILVMTRVPSFMFEQPNAPETKNQAQYTTEHKVRCIGIDVYSHCYILYRDQLPNVYFQLSPDDMSYQEKQQLEQHAIFYHLTTPNSAQIPHIERCCKEYEFDYLGPIWTWNSQSKQTGVWNWLYRHVPSDILVIRQSNAATTNECIEQKRRNENEQMETKLLMRASHPPSHNCHDCPLLLLQVNKKSIDNMKRREQLNQILRRNASKTPSESHTTTETVQ